VSLDRKQLDALPQRFPRLFKHPLTWGFEHDAGWTNIVEAFCQRIDSALANEPAARFEVLQVKEKFGMLRFYYRLENGSEALALEIRHAVDSASEQSATTCEGCGAESDIVSLGGYITTRCRRCQESRR